MSKSLQRTKGKIAEPYFVFIYGVAGVGKSTLANQAPGTVFIDIEGGTSKINAERYPQPQTYKEFLEQMNDVANDPAVQTVAIDTIDHLELLLQREVCEEAKVDCIADIPYGGGYEKAKEKWAKLITSLEKLRKVKNVILLGHCEVKQFNDPSMPAPYDRYQIKLDKRALALVKDRVDAVLFATYETYVNIDKNTKRAKAFGGDKRILLTEYRAHHDGKNRFGLPYQIDLSWDAFTQAAQAGNPESPDVLCSQIDGLLTKLTDEELKKKASEQYESAKQAKAIERLVQIKNRLVQVTQE